MPQGPLASLIAQLGEKRHEKGKAFERLCQWYLLNDPEYRYQLRKVWLWDEWAGRWGVDAGIDLVAETRDGRLWAIQAKAYHPSHRITKRDVDTFLSESARPEFSYRLLIATTDLIGATARRTLEAQEKHAGLRLWSDLEASGIEWPVSLDDLSASPSPPKSPRPHQEEAIQAVCGALEDCDRGQLLMACGTGKTLVALWIAERLRAGRTLILLPSLSLLAQTLREWTANASEPFAFLPVCSDETVRGNDTWVTHTADLGFPVTTAPDEIATFLDQPGRRVVLSTYHSSPRVVEALGLTEVAFDLAIADEAHRVAGPVAGDFATILDPEAIRASRRLFMTATPRYFTGRVRKAAGEADFEIASMDDDERFGPVLHRLPFSEAIERRLLADYRVLIVGVDDPTYRAHVEQRRFVTKDGQQVTDAQSLAAEIALAKAMRDYDLRRVISFHGRIKRARDFSLSFPETVAWMPTAERPSGELSADFVSGEMTTGIRRPKINRLRDLENTDRYLLANARCLGEGVDIPALDGVAFIDPRSSQIDIVQAVGRAIRLAEGKELGTIVVPVFVGGTDDPEAALEGSTFRPVWDVLKALRTHDDVLAEELDGLRRGLGRGTEGGSHLPEKVVVDLPFGVGTHFVEAVSTRIVEASTASWEFWYGLLCKYVDREGHASPPLRHDEDGHHLGVWVVDQRGHQTRGALSPDRLSRLIQLPGWVWNTKEAAWEAGYAALCLFADREGHSSAPLLHVESGHRVGYWVANQRGFRTRGTLSRARATRLERLPGWTWTTHETAWERGFAALESYAYREGHASVPASHTEDDVQVGRWINQQRNAYRRGTLSAERAARLEELPGWVWNERDAAWEKAFAVLGRFACREGHASPPRSHEEDGFGLGQWVSGQRRSYSSGSLAPERAARLERLPGWVWSTLDAAWDERYAALRRFLELEGHASPGQRLVDEDGIGLGQWINQQRNAYRRGTLSAERAARLEELPGWVWNERDAAWEKALAVLGRFACREGHASPPRSHEEDGVRLGLWVLNQRSRRRTLNRQRIIRLEQLPNWVWNAQEGAWEAGYAALCRFVEREGNASPVQRYDDQDGYRLGQWVSMQRSSYVKGDLDLSRVERLEALPGWTWHARQHVKGKRRAE